MVVLWGYGHALQCRCRYFGGFREVRREDSRKAIRGICGRAHVGSEENRMEAARCWNTACDTPRSTGPRSA